MQLKNDLDGRNALQRVILGYYAEKERAATCFLDSTGPDGGICLHFLVDRRRVIRYCIGIDRGLYLGVVQLAIGPHYFSAADFWSYESSKRFTLETTPEAVIRNLMLLDEFWEEHG